MKQTLNYLKEKIDMGLADQSDKKRYKELTNVQEEAKKEELTNVQEEAKKEELTNVQEEAKKEELTNGQEEGTTEKLGTEVSSEVGGQKTRNSGKSGI